MKTILLVIHLILLAFLGTSVSAETVYEAFQKHSLDLKVQTYYKDCGPISFFNAMVLAPKDLKKSLTKLPGKNRDDKYRSFMSLYGTKPSLFNANAPRFNPDAGMNLFDLAAMGNDLVAGQNSHFNAKSIDQLKTPFATTIENLRSSLAKGFGPILALTFMSSDPSKTSAGHAILLLDILSVNDVQKTATLKILNPDGFDVTTMEVAEDSRGWLEASAQNIWPAELPTGLMIFDSFIVLED